jgi:alginate O-acetyltransferase complex protein AlgJ
VSRAACDFREEQAKAEIGVTAISRAAATGAAAVFLLTIVTVSLVDQSVARHRGWPGVSGRSLRELETALEGESVTARAVRPVVVKTLVGAFRTGTENAHVGREGWLFYDPDVRHVAGRGFLEPRVDAADFARRRMLEVPREPNPIPAILNFHEQLGARGVTLVVVPTPVKPGIHPEKLSPATVAPAESVSFARFKEELRSHGILVFDMTGDLVDLAGTGRPCFLSTDTHWRPEAMDLAARRLVQFVNDRVALPQSLGVRYRRTQNRIEGVGDLAAMLGSSAREDVTIQSVFQPNGQPWSPQGDADVLWLGDSFSNIYSAEPMGWGAAAGFAEQFSFHLGRPVDAIRRNDAGAFATRQMLADDLARGVDRLAGKKLVVWQFAARELSFGDWKPIELKLNPRPVARLTLPPPGESWIVTGVVASKGIAPRPGNVAYRDHVLAVHLIDVSVEGRGIAGAQAVVYLRSMTDGKLTDAAALQVGQRVRMKVRDWSEVARQFQTINRSDVPEADLRTQPPCWGELLR